MRSFLINKNLCLYYWLKRRIGKRGGFRVANSFEKAILIFGREHVKKRKCEESVGIPGRKIFPGVLETLTAP